MMDSDFFLGPYKKKQLCYRQIIVLYGPSSPLKLPMCREHIAMGYLHSFPFRVPETNSSVAMEDGKEKGESSYVIMQHQQQPPVGFQILHQSSPPVIPRSRQGFLKMSKSWFLKAASATTRLLAGLCGWDSHILAVTPTRHLSALLCPALFINIFLSIQHKVHFATQRAWNSNDLCLNGKLHQTPCQTGCG